MQIEQRRLIRTYIVNKIKRLLIMFKYPLSTIFIIIFITVNDVSNKNVHVKPDDSKDDQNTLPVVHENVGPTQINVVEEPKPVNQQYPHAVLFGRTCGGSIISAKWILTAGHWYVNNYNFGM